MSRDALDFLSGGAPTAKFLEIGTVHKGEVRSYEKTQQRDMETSKPLFWEDTGEPMWQIVFTIETDERDPDIEGDDGSRRIFAKGNMLKAIRQALKAAGWAGRDPRDGILAVKYDADDKPTRRGFNPPKLYRAQFTPPEVEYVELITEARDPFADPEEHTEYPEQYAQGEEPF